MGENKEEETRLFSMLPNNTTRGRRYKLKHRKFQLKGLFFFTVKVVKHCNTLLRETVESPSAVIIQTQLGRRQAIYCRLLCLRNGNELDKLKSSLPT